MAEFVLNKVQHLTFDSSSSNGILLFREVSKLLVAYGSRILSIPNVADIYGFKYKGIWITLTVLSRAYKGILCIFGSSIQQPYGLHVESGCEHYHAYGWLPKIRIKRP